MSKRSRQISPSEAVDQQLARYRAMRDFAMTAEPHGSSSGKSSPASELPFLIQKHAATRLHYDFRLGWRGVLKSWAVTKGPSYNTADKRLAVEVEDHPIEYGGFEGTIPKGQYGGGTVMIWDQGTWEPVTEPEEGLRKGHLKFILHGQKLHGHWALIRMHPREHDSKPNWLLIKEHDEFERGPDEPAITEEAPNSAVTGRSLEEIAAQDDHVWNSNRPESKIETRAGRFAANRSRLKVAKAQAVAAAAAPDRETVLHAAPQEKMPDFIAPQLAVSVAEPPEGEEWLHELKLDGYRIQLHIHEMKSGRKVQLFTRKGLDWTHRMAAIAATARHLPVHAAILDGEVVVLDAEGGTSFAELQAAFDEGAPRALTYFAFDLLHLDGHNLRNLPLQQRKTILEGLLQEVDEQQTVRYSSHIRASGGEMFRHACHLGAEGVVSKLASAPYQSTRSRAWLKSKCVLQQEFVIGGYTPLSSGEQGIGSLLLGYYDGGKLTYAGRTGTGFTQRGRESVEQRLQRLRQAKSPFHVTPAEAKKDAIWVRPELVVEARFATWTGDHRVRQAAFLGMREDKNPRDVVREDVAPTPKTSRGRHASSTPSLPESANGQPGSTNAKPGRKHSARVKGVGTVQKTTSSRVDIAGVHLSHPDKVLDELTHLTKRQLAEYYAAVADHTLPHIAGRPLSIVRCPEGSGKPCFFQKHIGMGVPTGIDSVPIRSKKGGEPEEYLTLSTREGLVGLAQMGVLEIHPWGSCNESLETPDRFIIDLDPDPTLPWERLVKSAVEVRDLMKQLGLRAFVKSTGGKGIHVVAPIQPRLEWPEVKEFAHTFVLMMERANPKLYLTKMTKSARKGRIFLDYLRNERGATAVAPWSPRARPGARVAVPLTWAELERSTETPQFSVSDFDEWKTRLKRDPWKDLDSGRQDLSDHAVAAVREMLGGKSA